MAVADVVKVLTEYCEDGEETFRDLHGPEAVIAVRDVVDVLERELGVHGQLAYEALWRDFEAAPRETAPELTGALEALSEADPGFAEKLEVLLEEYYATSRPVGPTTVADEVPQAEVSEFVPREETRVEEQEAEPLGHADEAGEGTYLYGNVRAGSELGVQKTLELGSDVLDVRREEEMLSFDVDELFEQLQVTVDEELELNEATEKDLSTALEELEVELMLGEEADEDRIVALLREVGEIDPGLLDLVLSGLRHTRSQAMGLMERVMAEWERGRGGEGENGGTADVETR
jgi:hypothetical protein